MLITTSKAMPGRRKSCCIFVAIACSLLVLDHRTQGVIPPPDGGYPGNNTAEGQNALLNLTTGTFNTAVGSLSLKSDMTGSGNTAIGMAALLANTADQNTATGVASLLSNTTGTQNTANGALALLNNTDGDLNSACGAFALFSNTSGASNTADGAFALFANLLGSGNTAVGTSALHTNSTGSLNTAVGDGALSNNTTAGNNVAIGDDALLDNSTGHDNTASGHLALVANNAGNSNTANGAFALSGNTAGNSNTGNGEFALSSNTTGNTNTAEGSFALSHNTTGSGNSALGFNAGSGVTTANNVICIGIAGQNVSDSLYVGNVFQTNIDPDNLPVRIDLTGKLGTQSSSRRFKEDIKPIDKASEVILAMKPVSFHYKNDTKHSPQFGLIAEEVAEIDPTLVAFDKERKPYTIRYDQVNAMLLNEFLKEHRKVQELEKGMIALKEQLREQGEQIQKMSAQIEIHGYTTKVELVAGVADPATGETEEKK